MTDNEIINALSKCWSDKPVVTFIDEIKGERTELSIADIASIIKRQRAEIEGVEGALRAEESRNTLIMQTSQKALKNAKSEAIDEFAARLKESFNSSCNTCYDLFSLNVILDIIDEIAEEFT